MQAIIVVGHTVSVVDDYPEPVRQPGEALLRVRVAGICSTDLEIVKGYAGFSGVLGHEFVADVVEADDAAWVGQRVVGTINLSPVCGGACGRRCPEHCPDRTVLGIIGRNGVFAEYTTLPAQNLLRVPDSVPDDVAVFTEPLAAAARVVEQVAPAPATRAAVIGPGRLGMLTAQALHAAGVPVRVLGRSAPSLQLAHDLGMRAGLAADSADASYDLVVEATGNQAGLAHALRLVVPQGTVVLKSTYASDAQVDLTPLVVNEITVLGSRCGPFDTALELLQGGAIETESLIDGRYALADGAAALAHAARPGVRKILLYPNRYR